MVTSGWKGQGRRDAEKVKRQSCAGQDGRNHINVPWHSRITGKDFAYSQHKEINA